MKDVTLVKTGTLGSIVTAICCFTPALVILPGFAGLSSWLGWLDFVLLPMLVGFLGLTAYGLWRRRCATACNPVRTQTNDERS